MVQSLIISVVSVVQRGSESPLGTALKAVMIKLASSALRTTGTSVRTALPATKTYMTISLDSAKLCGEPSKTCPPCSQRKDSAHALLSSCVLGAAAGSSEICHELESMVVSSR